MWIAMRQIVPGGGPRHGEDGHNPLVAPTRAAMWLWREQTDQSQFSGLPLNQPLKFRIGFFYLQYEALREAGRSAGSRPPSVRHNILKRLEFLTHLILKYAQESATW